MTAKHYLRKLVGCQLALNLHLLKQCDNYDDRARQGYCVGEKDQRKFLKE